MEPLDPLCFSSPIGRAVFACGSEAYIGGLVTAIYALNSENDRKGLWGDLRSLDLAIEVSWVLLGDFNEVIDVDEKVIAGVSQLHASGRKDLVTNMGLRDTISLGVHYRWCNNQEGQDRVSCKLDRVLANPAWMDQFGDAFIEYKEYPESDRALSHTYLRRGVASYRSYFKFLNMWQSHNEYSKLVEKAWLTSVGENPIFILYAKMKLVKVALQCLNREYFQDISCKVASLQHEVEALYLSCFIKIPLI